MEKKRASSLRTGKLLQFFVVIGVIIGIFAASIGWLAGNIRQGLDLQGGTHIIMQAEDTEQNKVTTESIVQVINIMQKRVNEMGLTEPIIQREGANRIIIELPGERDPQKAIETIGKTAVLEFRDEEGNVCLTGEDLKDAREQIGQNREPLVALQLSKEGGDKFAKLTAANIGGRSVFRAGFERQVGSSLCNWTFPCCTFYACSIPCIGVCSRYGASCLCIDTAGHTLCAPCNIDTAQYRRDYFVDRYGCGCECIDF